MQAIGYTKQGAPTADNTLTHFEAPTPELGPHDLLIEVHGISVNPVDTKVRQLMVPEGDQPKIIGYDAAGIVRATGSQTTRFKKGDQVYYAGDLTRPGSNAALQAVDERIVGKKPQTLDFAEAAGLPLTSITAWELLFDSLKIQANDTGTLLITGAAGGVGSILIQLAKQLTQLTVIATASRPETIEWARKMGADHVINHHQPLAEQLNDLGQTPNYIASLTATDQHFPALVDCIQPRGQIALIDDPTDIDIKIAKPKALSIHWEFMFTRSMFQTPDIDQQHRLLNKVSELIDQGTLQSTVTQNLGPVSAKSLQAAHQQQLTGTVIGKTVFANKLHQ